MHTLEGTLSTLDQSTEIPDIDSLIDVLHRCRKSQMVTCLSRTHLLIHDIGLETHIALGNHLVPVLVDCGFFCAAQQAFYKLPYHNEHSWTSLIQGFSECKEGSHQIPSLLQAMQEDSAEPTSYTFLALSKICLQSDSIEAGQQVHAEIIKEGFEEDPYVGSALVGIYARFDALLEAQDIFNNLVVRDVVLWTLLISQYVEHGCPQEALSCLQEIEVDGVSMDATMCVCLLKACTSVGALDKGREIHAVITGMGFDGDLFVGNSLIDMYSKCGCLEEAWQVLDKLGTRDVVSWNSLIASYSEVGLGEEVLMCLEMMRMEGVHPNNITLVCAIQTLSMMKERGLVQAIHSQILKEGNELDLFVGNSLLDSYSKCGLLLEAQYVFQSLPVKDIVSWTSMLAGFSEQGLFKEAFDCLEQMQLEGISMDAVSLVCILKTCSSIGALESGMKLHAFVAMNGFENDSAIGNILIDMYANCDSLLEAQETFDDLWVQNVVSWNALLAGYAERGLGDETLECLERMKWKGVSPDAVTYVCGLQGCGSIIALDCGRNLHIELANKGYDSELLVGNALVDLYSKCESFDDAHEVFDGLKDQSVVSWAALLAGYVESGLCLEAIECFEQMKLDGVSPNTLTYVYILRACGKLKAFDKGQVLYADMVVDEVDMDQLTIVTLVNLYARCGSLLEAQEMFDSLHVHDIASWNALLTGCADYGLNEVVIESFAQMEYEGVSPDAVTYACCLRACGRMDLLSFGQFLHSEIVKDHLELGTSVYHALIDMYANFSLFEDVKDVFDELPAKTIATWNVLLTCYNVQGLSKEVLGCFEKLQSSGLLANACTYACCLSACIMLEDVDKGRQLHVALIGDSFDDDPFVSSSLVGLYSRCGLFEEALDVLYAQPVKGTMLWNALLLGYTKHGCNEDALDLLDEMCNENVCLDAVTYLCSLKACMAMGAMEKGKELHTMIVQEEYESESIVGNTLVDMYAKCGLLVEAQEVFDELSVQDAVSWSALISGHACQGDVMHVWSLFQRMREEGISPDEVLLLRLLSACSHAGLVERGQIYFENVGRDYNIAITVEHVNCMMDLLSRAGQLDESVAMTERFPCVPDKVTWTTMLGACRKWGDLDLGRQAFEGAANVDNSEAASFILMSNIYAGVLPAAC